MLWGHILESKKDSILINVDSLFFALPLEHLRHLNCIKSA